MVPGYHYEQARGTHQRFEIADIPSYPNLGCAWILTLHLSYVAGYTDPLLFLFERTYNYYVDNQGLMPWWLRRLGGSKVRSAS